MMTDPLLRETVERCFDELCTHDAVQAAERSGWADELWDAARQMGLPWISLPVSGGGSGGTLADAIEVLRIAGRHAVPLPLAETGLLAGWLLSEAGLALDDEPMTLVPGRPDDTLVLDGGLLRGEAHRVAWGRRASRIAVLTDHRGETVLAVARGDEAEIRPVQNVAGEPRDTVVFHGAPAEIASLPSGVDRAAVRARGALTRVALMAGALERMCETTVGYTRERHQFGKPIARFQAVEEHLVCVAQEAALLLMTLEAATAAAQRGDARFEIAAAKVLADRAATRATRAAHQAHGAIGLTQEYPLHQLSRRLWSWRQEYGTAAQWRQDLGLEVSHVGGDGLYPLIAGGSTRL
jgi:acyl-CoA dehydrogenase